MGEYDEFEQARVEDARLRSMLKKMAEEDRAKRVEAMTDAEVAKALRELLDTPRLSWPANWALVVAKAARLLERPTLEVVK